MKKTLLAGIALLLAVPGWAPALDPDFKLLQSVGLKTDGPALLQYFRDRTFKEADPKKVADLVILLGDDSFAAREKAYKDLLQIGQPALVGLKQAETHSDMEIRLRVNEVRQIIMAKVDPLIQAAVARLVAATKPAGAAEVILAYLPFAADQSVSDELCAAVKATAFRDGKADEAVVKSLHDPLPLKRIAAAEALASGPTKEHLPAIRKMLQDADPQVRLRIGLALASSAKDKEALPVLVELLGTLPAEQLWQVEEILVRLAGKDIPNVPLGNTDETKKKCRDTWKDWLAKNQDKIDLTKLNELQALFGYTLIVQQSINRIIQGKRIPRPMGEVMELDKAKNKRWKPEVHHLSRRRPGSATGSGCRVAEYHGRRITERDFTGKINWEQQVGGNPIGVQGLPNEHVFVVMQNRLVEYDRSHKEVFSHNRPNHDIFRARKLRNGDVVFVTNGGQFTRTEAATQRIVKPFHVGNIPVLFGSIDILPNGGVLIPDFQQNRVVEFDADGKQVSTFHVQWPNSVMRLPNGHTLVGSQNTRRVIEFDSRGQEVWSYVNAEGMVFNTRKR